MDSPKSPKSPKVRDRPSREGIIKLMRGDIITLHAPETTRGYHLKTFFIDYIDDELVRLLSDQSESSHQSSQQPLEEGDAVVVLHLDEHGRFKDADSAIKMVELIARAPEHGYARQRGFKQGTWLEIHFKDGNANGIIIGQIITLAEGSDCIGISIFNSPSDDIGRIYIDFEFKGLSHDYIREIRICDEPEAARSAALEQSIDIEPENIDDIDDDGRSDADVDADADAGTDTARNTHDDDDTERMSSPPPLEFDSDAQNHAIQAGDVLFLGFVTDREQMEFDVDVPEHMVRHDLDVQQNDLMESLFSDLRTDRRTLGAQKAIQREVDRFTELRKAFSIEDDHGRTQRQNYYTDDYKPLAEYLAAFPDRTHDMMMYDGASPLGDWLIPIYVQRRKLYAKDADEKAELDECIISSNHANDAHIMIMGDQMQKESDEYDQYNARQAKKTFSDFADDIKMHFTPFVRPFQEIPTAVLTGAAAAGNGAFDAIITGYTNPESLQSPAYAYNKMRKSKFSCTAYGNMVRYIAQDELPKRAAAYITRPLPFVNLAARKQPSASVLDRAHAGYLASTDSAYLSLCMWNLGADDRALFKTRRVASSEVRDHELFVSSREFFVPDNDDDGADVGADDDAKLFTEATISNMVPPTSALFNIVKTELANYSTAISPRVLVCALDPFLIQQRHVTQVLFSEFAAFISDRIAEYKERLDQMKAVNSAFANREYGVEPTGLNSLYEMVMRRHQHQKHGSPTSIFDATVVANYGLKEWAVNVNARAAAAAKRGDRTRILSNSELLSKVMSVDNGRCFMNEIVQLNHSPTYSLFGQNVDRVISQFADEAGEFVAAKEMADRKSSVKCKNLVLTKEYYSLEELTTDNEMKQQQGIDILYDIKHDPTDYEFINDEYRAKERSMPREVFKTFLISEVMRKKKLREHDAALEAESIINGVRRVQRGDHSVVVVRKLDVDARSSTVVVKESDSDSVAYYYYKLDGAGSWVRDHAIPETIRSDDASFFCNVQPKCIQMKEQCASLETSAGQVNSKLLNSMAKADLISRTQQEFESQFNIGSTDFAEYMKQKESYDAYRMTKNRVLLRLEQTAQNDREFIRGLNEAAAAAAVVSDNGSGKSILISAATGILGHILADESFSRKQLLIVNFVNKYTRPGSETDADKHWLVCKETGVKLMPRWMHVRAAAFIGGGGSAEYVPAAAASYAEVLDQLCREYGAQEGDVWVDRITGSGAVIKSVNFSHDEGYDEDGFKQVSHSVIENANAAATNAIATDRARDDYPGMADAVTMSINEQLKSPNAHKINDIVQRTLIEGLGISPDRNKLRMRIISKVIDTMSTTPLFSDESKAEFMKQCRERAPPGQAPAKSDKECADLYAAYADRLIITLTLSHIVIALQCAMPSVRPSNLLQECAKYYNAPNPFGGFPLEGTKTDAMHCIKYIACVATKIKNKSNVVWASFKKSRHQIEEDIVDLIEQFIIKIPRIRDEMAAKRQDTIDRQNMQSASSQSQSQSHSRSQENALPKSLSTSNWKHFFPLLHSLDGIKSVAELSPEVKSMYLKELKTCRRTQFDTQEILRGKIMQYSLYIQKCVQDIVRNEGSLLLFSGETPATENACCDETLAAGSSAIQYFIRKSELIREYNVVVSCLNNIFVDIAHISRAVMFCNMDDTRTTAGATSSDFSEDTVYRGFVAFCKLDRNIPVINPAILKLAGKKPEDYNDRDEWRDKIRKLKSENSALYSQEGFEKLLNIVNAGGIIGTTQQQQQQQQQPSRIEPLRRILSSAAIQEVQVQEHVEVVSEELQGDLVELLDTYNQQGSNLESGVEVKCYNRLHEENSKMISGIRAAIIPQHQQSTGSAAVQPPKSKRSGLGTVATPAELIEFIEYADQFDEEAKSERASLRYASNEDAATVKYVQFIKRSIRFMIVTIPGLLTQSSFETATGVIIPRHWNFSTKHGSDIAAIVGKQCTSLEEFFNKESVRRCVSQIMPLDGDAADTSLCGIIMQLVNAVPFTANNRSVLSARITRQLYKYLFVRVIKIYAYFIDNPTGKINVSVDLSASAAAKQRARSSNLGTAGTAGAAAVAAAADIMAAEAKQVSDAISDFLDPTQLTSVQQAHRDTIVPASFDAFQMLQDSKTQMRRLLIGVLRIVRSFKMESNKTVESVMQATAISKRTETEQIRHKLRSMDVDKRNVVDILKKNRIGEWNVNQKQLTRYDKKTYDTGLGVVAATDAADAYDDEDEDATELAIAGGIISKNRLADDIDASASAAFDPEQYEQAIAASTQSNPEIDGQNAFAACDGDDYDNDQVMRNEFGISTTCH